MNKLAILALMAATCVTSHAAPKRIPVDKFEALVGTLHSKADREAASRIGQVQLTERLSDERFNRMLAAMPGDQSRQALTGLADAAAFFDLPAADVSSQAPPDQTAQHAILASMFEYVRQALPRLPNFFATRDTVRFEDTPPAAHANAREFSIALPLHFVGESTDTVLYRNGNEVVDTAEQKRPARDRMELALSTSGAFGPILPTVLADASHAKLIWSHWENEFGAVRAVYRFTVPQQLSHYTVDSAGMADDEQLVPGYHGEIEVDPSTGYVVRLTMAADLGQNDPVREADIMVQYGPVTIGGQTYICPVKSVARSMVRTIQQPGAKQLKPKYTWDADSSVGMRENASDDDSSSSGAPQLRVNDVTFRKYHLFRAETRIVNADGSSENKDQRDPSHSSR
jgi:hypothetical protein